MLHRILSNNIFDMLKSVIKIFLLTFFLSVSVLTCYSQSEAGGKALQKEDLPKNIKETLEKKRIEQEKKDHDELLKKAEEALRLSAELQESFKKNNGLSAEDQKKLDKLEKLLKKIRKELGGDDDGEEALENDDKKVVEDKNSRVVNALNKLSSASVNLLDELKKTSRFSISAVAIESSNIILKVIRFLRFSN